MAIKFEVPKNLWTNNHRTRAYKQLKGKSKNFNEEFRLWCKKHNGTIVWSQEQSSITIEMLTWDNVGTIKIPTKTFYDTWVVYFESEEDAMLFKLTWL